MQAKACYGRMLPVGVVCCICRHALCTLKQLRQAQHLLECRRWTLGQRPQADRHQELNDQKLQMRHGFAHQLCQTTRVLNVCIVRFYRLLETCSIYAIEFPHEYYTLQHTQEGY